MNKPKKLRTKPQIILNFIRWYFLKRKIHWPKINIKPINAASLQNDTKLQATYIGHATTFIQTPGFSFLTDPIWSKVAGPYSLVGVKRIIPAGINIKSLGKLDAVLISHNHYDHCDIRTLRKLKKLYHPHFFVPKGLKKFLTSKRIEPVIELDWWQSIHFKNAIITLLPAKHWSGRGLNDRLKTLWGSFGVEVNGKKIYFAGDTGFGTHFKEISKRWGHPDLALLPIGAYEPRWFMKNNHLNPHDAVIAFKDLKAKFALAIHFDVYPLGQEQYQQAIHDLSTARKVENIANDRFFTLSVGEHCHFSK